jgi:potassium voltage-gated channel Eag-related subfamily H protein 7
MSVYPKKPFNSNHAVQPLKTSAPTTTSPAEVRKSVEEVKEAEHAEGAENHYMFLDVQQIIARQSPNTFPKVAYKNSFVLNPLSPRRRAWDLISTFMLGFVASVTPFEIAFLGSDRRGSSFANLSTARWVLFVANRIVDLFFLADLVINFMTGSFSVRKGRWITTHSGIAKAYLSGWFWIDFISVIPFDMAEMVLASAENSSDGVGNLKILRIYKVLRLLRLTKLLRILRFSRIVRRLQDEITLSFRSQAYLWALVEVVFCSHLGACLFRLIGELEYTEGSTNNWMETKEVIDKPLFDQYIASVQWSVSALKASETLSNTPAEHSASVLMTVLGAAVIAQVTSTVVNTMINLDQSKIKQSYVCVD